MKDLLIVGGVVVVAYLLLRNSGGSVTLSASPGAQTSSTSGGYQVVAPGTLYGTPGTPSSPSSQPTFMAPAPVAAAPPPYYGGTAGTAGSGGNPLGGSLRAGISSGTGTTSPFSGPHGGPLAMAARVLPAGMTVKKITNTVPIVIS